MRLSDWTTVTRARTVEAATNEPAVVIDTAVELLRAYAPDRPVRLLGVRVAGFEDVEPDAAPHGGRAGRASSRSTSERLRRPSRR